MEGFFYIQFSLRHGSCGLPRSSVGFRMQSQSFRYRVLRERSKSHAHIYQRVKVLGEVGKKGAGVCIFFKTHSIARQIYGKIL